MLTMTHLHNALGKWLGELFEQVLFLGAQFLNVEAVHNLQGQVVQVACTHNSHLITTGTMHCCNNSHTVTKTDTTLITPQPATKCMSVSLPENSFFY